MEKDMRIVTKCSNCGARIEHDIDMEFKLIRTKDNFYPGCVIYLGECAKCGHLLDNISLFSPRAVINNSEK